MRIFRPHVTLHSFLVPNLWLKVNRIVCPKLSFHFISLARCLLLHRTPSTSSSSFPTVPGLQRLLTSRNSCADPREPRGDGSFDPEPRTHLVLSDGRTFLPCEPSLFEDEMLYHCQRICILVANQRASLKKRWHSKT